MTTPTLAIGGIRLRQVVTDDAAAMQKHFANRNVIRNIGGVPWPYPPDGARTYIDRRLAEARERELYFWGIFLAAEPAALIGAIEYRFFPDEPENRGFWLAERCWGRGIMTAAVAITQDFVFLDLAKPRLTIHSRADNAASRVVKEKTGARRVGRARGDYLEGPCDEDVWEVTTESWRAARSGLTDLPLPDRGRGEGKS